MDLDLKDSSRELDFDLRPGAGRPETPRRRGGGRAGPLIVLGLLVGALAVFFYWRPLPFSQSGEAHRRAAASAPSATVPTEFGPVPALDASDEFVRALVRQLSARPELIEWMAKGNLVRTLVVSVDKMAIGSSPAREMKAAAPTAKFQATGAGRTLRIDPVSYERYNTLANVIDAVDVEGAARAYRRLRPLLQQAFDELGYTNLSFDERLALALGRLVDAPVPEGDVELRATSVTFQFADPELEGLAPVQKHMIRMGPRNMRLIQSKLRAFARAAGLTQGPPAS